MAGVREVLWWRSPMRIRATLFIFAAALADACVRPQVQSPAPQAPLRLCNDSSSGLRLRANWQAFYGVAPGECTTVKVPSGDTLVTVYPTARPYDWLRHPAAKVAVPPTGAEVRYGEYAEHVDLV